MRSGLRDQGIYKSLLVMRKATLTWLLGFMKFTLAAILFFRSSKSSDVDFFDIVDQTTAEYLTAERRGRNLGRSGGSSAAVISPPRNNKYLEASMQIIKGMNEAKRESRRLSSRGRRKLKQSIRNAIKDSEIPKALNLVGHLFRPECHCPKSQAPCGRLPKHCKKTPSEHENVFKQLRKILGDDLDTLLGRDGNVSLIFVIDTTGSMGDEIEAAKRIVKAIAAHPRKAPVQYILSPYGDPLWGNTMSFSDESSFVSALDRLTAFGGNDCPELAFNGIIDAIEIGKPAITSPMFVLTDAGVKPGEGPKYTLDNALGVVMNNLIPVNFFYSTESGSCGTFQRHEAFVELVDETEGFAMQFNSSGEIMKMSEAMALALDGTTTILEGRSTTSRGRTLRSARDKTYTIPVDDTIETLLVTYIASNDPHRVELRNPARLPQPRTENLAQGGVWIIKRPTHGIWSLVFPANTGTHTVKVQSTSAFNLDFDYLFFDGQELGGEWHDYVAQYPLLGSDAKVKLLIPSRNRLNLGSLRVTLIDKWGRELPDSVELATPSLEGTFNPPLEPFKLKLSGRTAMGQSFQRISPRLVTAKNLRLRQQGRKGYSLLTCGRTLRLYFVIDYNCVDCRDGEKGAFDISVNSSLITKTPTGASTTAISATYNPVVFAMSSSKAFVTVRLYTPSDVTGILNKMETIQVTARMRRRTPTPADVTSFVDSYKVTCSP